MHFLPDSCSDTTYHALYTYKTVVCTVDPVTALKWIQVTFPTCTNNNALLKWAKESHQLLPIMIIQKKLRGHATKQT